MIIERASAPTLFVRSVKQTAAFYGVKLGFAVIFPGPSSDASVVVICRGGDQLCFREVGESVQEVRPAGTPRWHASVRVPDADALAADFLAHDVPLSAPLSDRPGGLRGFEIVDPDGHVLLFAHPQISLVEEPAPAAAIKGMSWIAHGWVWIEAATVLGAVV
jgi:catechol 2,3-dioxygenase-like lactoylglutathione lyase family enzyme